MDTHGATTLNQKVEEIMSQAHTCKMDDDVRSVMRQMTFKRVRHVPVVEGGVLKGMVSIGDIVKNQLDEAQLEIGIMRDFAPAYCAGQDIGWRRWKCSFLGRKIRCDYRTSSGRI